MAPAITQVYFSPSGSTKKVAEYLAAGIGLQTAGKVIDLLKKPVVEEVSFGKDELLIVSMPVYAGRIPAICADSLAKLRGAQTPAIAVVVYGNRDYDDALLELCDILDEQGFVVIGAAAFIARHTIFSVAEGRPDDADFAAIENFARKCAAKLELRESERGLLSAVPGSRPYKEPGAVPLKPDGNDACNGCGTCVALCPVGAIAVSAPRQTDAETCITCTACIFACPQKARGFHSEMYPMANQGFMEKNSRRCEPVQFF